MLFRSTCACFLMQSTIGKTMGNCVACTETTSDAETPSDPVIYDMRVSETKEPTPMRTGHQRVSLSATDIGLNGNARTAPSSEQGTLTRERSLRVLYSRIQPLTRGSESKQKEVSDSKLNALFETYRDSDMADFILADGIERMLNDLNLAPDEFKVLVLAWKLNAERMCQFSRQEFLTGLKGLRADSLQTLNVRLNEVHQEIVRNPNLFKDLYRFAFRFGLDPGQRILPIDMAMSLWKIVFSCRPSPLLDRWLEYLVKTSGGGIPRDTWNMFLYLTDQLGGDLSLYDDSHAWPSIFDDFVEYENDRVNQNVAKDKPDVIEDCT